MHWEFKNLESDLNITWLVVTYAFCFEKISYNHALFALKLDLLGPRRTANLSRLFNTNI